MKQWGVKVATAIGLLSMSITPTFVVMAQEDIASSQPASATTNEATTTNLEGLKQAIADQQNLTKYRIHYGKKYIKYSKKEVDVVIVGDKSTGNARIELTYYGDTDDDNQRVAYKFELMTYQNFEHVYIKQSALLESLAFFDELMLTDKQKEQLAQYRDYYIELSPDQLKRIGLDNTTLFDLVYLAPTQAKLDELPAQDIYHFNDTYLVSKSLTDIPEHFFDQTRQLHLDFGLKLDINPTETGPQLQLTPKLDIAGNTIGLDIQGEITAQYRANQFSFKQIRNTLGQVDYQREFGIKSKSVMQKLKRMSISLNPKTQVYHLDLYGVVEEMKLNLWSSNPAYTRSYDYHIDYQLEPTDETLPDLLSLKRLSNQEYQYVLNQALKTTE